MGASFTKREKEFMNKRRLYTTPDKKTIDVSGLEREEFIFKTEQMIKDIKENKRRR